MKKCMYLILLIGIETMPMLEGDVAVQALNRVLQTRQQQQQSNAQAFKRLKRIAGHLMRDIRLEPNKHANLPAIRHIGKYCVPAIDDISLV